MSDSGDDDAKRGSHSPSWELASRDAITELMSGNADAVQFLYDISIFANTYDDLIDKDKSLTDENIHTLMGKMMVEMPSNKFFQDHQSEILPVITTGLLNYHAANQIEVIGELEELRVSHCLRYSMIDVGLLCMKITGGYDFASKNARRARLMLQNDTWEHYKKEHYKEG
jgi:hypothetical protein